MFPVPRSFMDWVTRLMISADISVRIISILNFYFFYLISARQFAAHHHMMHAHHVVRPSSPMRSSSAVPVLMSQGYWIDLVNKVHFFNAFSWRRMSPASEYSLTDFPPEELHSLLDSAQNQRPLARKSRPSSACRSRTPSPSKTQNSSEDDPES